ncbi:hypothetical protein BGZ63DRAFT_338976, partial [Mariannaea sp. PMI_226]
LSKRQDGPTDPGIAKDCTFWDTALDSSYNCDYFEKTWSISRVDFVSWNPSIKPDCTGLVIGHSYCVERNFGLPSSTSTTSSPTKPTSTVPSPTQPGLTKDCIRFYKSKKGDTCDSIAAAYGTFSTADFVIWNPAVGSGCTDLWADTYYCVGVPGTPTSPPTATTTKNPVETCNPGAPQPVQPGAICGCDKWHKVGETTTCAGIIDSNHISAENFYKWNPKVGKDCKGLWKGYYVCVGIPGTPTKPPTTTTKPPKPTETCNPGAPQPVQPGAVCGCDKWHKVGETTTCAGIIDSNHISAENFYKWNPKVGKDCKGLWKGYYVCVGVPGTPTKPPTTTAKPPKPTETCNPGAPQPVQPGTVCHCKKWYKVGKTTTCDAIIAHKKISKANFYKWNPKVGKDCIGLWEGYNVCVG